MKPEDSPASKKIHHPVLWVITSYVAEGIPFAMVIWVAGTMFKDLGHSDSEITIATASVGIVWSLKPLWAGFLDMFLTKKFFVLSTEFLMGGLFAVMGLALQFGSYFSLILGLLWIIAFASATQDICADGIYISSLSKERQAAFIGAQGMAWNLGRVIAVSVVVWLAGYLQEGAGLSPKVAWMNALFAAGALMTALGLYHWVVLPTGSVPESLKGQSAGDIVHGFLNSAADFCNKRALWGMLAFVFFYRSGEGLLLLEAPLFMQGCLEDGGLQLTLQDKGLIDGTVSTSAGIVGGLLGGVFISKFTLKRALFVLALCVNIPNSCYLYLGYAVSPENPLSFNEIAFVVSLEKFWYGFGFVGNMLYMMQQLAPGRFKMTHYAFATALMNLVLVPTQMASGPLADTLGFKEFFWIVMAACIPSLVAAWYAPFPQLNAPNPDLSVDDPSLLGEEEKTVQADARRATMWALLAVVVFLYVDVLALGGMSGVESGTSLIGFLVLLGVALALKVFLSGRAIVVGRKALANASKHGAGSAYLSNAKGAVIAGVVMVLISLGLGGYCVDKAVSTDWPCAFSAQAVECLQPDKKPPQQCAVKIIER